MGTIRVDEKISKVLDEDHEPTGHCPHTSVQYEKKGAKTCSPSIYKKKKEGKKKERLITYAKLVSPAKFRGRCRFMEIFCKVCR